MGRRRYLVCYDIRDPGRLREVAKTMLGFGQRLQYSVFACDLDGSERISMIIALKKCMRETVDSVMMVDLGDPSTRGRECFDFIGPRFPLPSEGAVIV